MLIKARDFTFVLPPNKNWHYPLKTSNDKIALGYWNEIPAYYSWSNKEEVEVLAIILDRIQELEKEASGLREFFKDCSERAKNTTDAPLPIDDLPW